MLQFPRRICYSLKISLIIKYHPVLLKLSSKISREFPSILARKLPLWSFQFRNPFYKIRKGEFRGLNVSEIEGKSPISRSIWMNSVRLRFRVGWILLQLSGSFSINLDHFSSKETILLLSIVMKFNGGFFHTGLYLINTN